MLFKLGEGLTIANAREVKQALLEGLQGHDALSLEACALAEIDVAGLQLLCATHRFAIARGKQVSFAPGPRPGLAAAAAKAGFAPGRGCPADCLCAEVSRG